MQHNRSWISLIGSCLLMALGAAFAFAIIVAAGSAALAGRQASDDPQLTSPAAPQTVPGGFYEGMVTDSRCGARGPENQNLWRTPGRDDPGQLRRIAFLTRRRYRGLIFFTTETQGHREKQ